MLRRLHGTRLDNPDIEDQSLRPLINVDILEFSALRVEIPEFCLKFGNPYLELSYSILHFIRTFFNRPASAGLHIVDRTALANLLYDLLFSFNGQHDYGQLFIKINSFDLKMWDQLTAAEIEKIRSVDFAFQLFAREMRRFVPNYHIFIAVADDPEFVAANMSKRGNQDASYDTYEYTMSQNFLFKRLAQQLPADMCTMLCVDRYVDETMFVSHLCNLTAKK